jgi:hypothetical protein
MKLEQNGTLPLPSVLGKKKMDGTLSNKAHKKTKHMDLNLLVGPYSNIWHKQSSPLLSSTVCEPFGIVYSVNSSTCSKPLKKMAIAVDTLCSTCQEQAPDNL